MIDVYRQALERIANDSGSSEYLAGIARTALEAEPGDRPQFDPGARVYFKEAIILLRIMQEDRERATGTREHGKYDHLDVAALNARAAYEWLWPKTWDDGYNLLEHQAKGTAYRPKLLP